MSATAISQTTGLTDVPPVCQILILCENYAAYERAAEVGRRMLAQFAGELDFDFKCWNFIELTDDACARSALKTGGTADIILVALHGTELPPVLEAWLAAISEIRIRADGALVLVWEGRDSLPAASEKLFARLRQLADHAGMDFVPLIPGSGASAHPVRQEEEWLMAAHQSENSSSPQCDHWGLNE